ncbi:MAG: ribonuclease H-like domain-containing protein [Sandaracinaceae bacterium]
MRSLKAKLARLRSAGPGSAPAPQHAPPEPVGSVGPGPLSEDADLEGADLEGAVEDVEARERKARIAKLRGMLGQMIADEKRRLRDRPVEVPEEPLPLPGETLMTAHGEVHRVASYLEPSHQHGRVPIARALDITPQTVAKLALDEGLGAIDPRKLVFLDTETTGLAGGTGTIPFLIGVAWFEDQSFRIEQLLLRAPGEETPMLRRLAEHLEGASAIVSYNGKSYDWPLLRTRFVLNRVPVVQPAAHLDLLHCARRVFKRRLGQVRLVHMEEHVLGMRREGDIDGAEIPERFWSFVRDADGSRLAPVIEHNANDVVALAAILVNLVERYEELRPEHDPEDRLGVAQVAVRAADPERAMRWAESAAEAGGPDDVTADALWLASELCRKRGDDEGRRALLHRALEAGGVDPRRSARAHLALSKLYEHRLKDFERALVHARATEREEGDESRDRRVARVLRKLERARRQLAMAAPAELE